MKMLPVIFGIDKSYVLQVFAVMHSILENSKAYYCFIILTKDEISDTADELAQILYQYHNNFSLSIRKLDKDVFMNVKMMNARISQASLFRLLIPDLVKEYDKCVYLDSDVLVNGDMEELFEISLGDCYLAGVKDCYVISNQNHQVRLNIPSVENYINAGVLVMNLKRMRQDGLVDKFLLQAEKNNLYADQDVLNVCCYGRIKILPIKYNSFHFYTGNTIRVLFDYPYQKEEFMFEWNKPYILHMMGRVKPWMNKKIKGADQWWDLVEIFRGLQIHNFWEENCLKELDGHSIIAEIFRSCNNCEDVIIWGFTEYGKDVCDIFLKKGISVYAFCDNDAEKRGMRYRNIPVVDASEVIGRKKERMWIICCKIAYREVHKQLLDLGEKDGNIVHFTYNSRASTYYLGLSPQFYEEEIKIIALCENDKMRMGDEEYLLHIQQIIRESDIDCEEYRYLYSKYRFDLWLKC